MIDLNFLRANNAPVWAIHLAKEIQELQGHTRQLFARVGLPHPGNVNTPPTTETTEPEAETSNSDAGQETVTTTPAGAAEAPGEDPESTTPTTE